MTLVAPITSSTARGDNGAVLSEKPMGQPDAWRMIRWRAAAAGIAEVIGCHTFRATGITAYLANGGAQEPAHHQALRPHERTVDPGRGRANSIVIQRRHRNLPLHRNSAYHLERQNPT